MLAGVTAPEDAKDWTRRNGDSWTPTPREHREQLAATAAARIARFLEGRPDVDELRKARAALDEAIADG
jgi:hypothetical protein